MTQTICIAGGGTMGSGIAQVAAQSGYTTLLYDINIDILNKAKLNIKKSLGSLVDKQKISAAESSTIFQRIHYVNNINDCMADVCIEAIVEKIEVKVQLFNALAAINTKETILASNTSSLSISAIQKEIVFPERVIGMHFFNPAQIMKLVEVVSGNQTGSAVAATIYALCQKLNKTPVMCKDVPGFIVNRVARHYYLEAMKLVESGVATIENIDRIMEAAGFKMGPFRLMDLIGMDINLAVSQSLYDAFGGEERLQPSPIQIEKVAKGELGRKAGKGFYSYPPSPEGELFNQPNL